ncbi:MAG: flagellar hook-basal body protein [Bacillota bacterium]
MRGLYLSEGTMLVQQAQLQVISNNMANIRSTGYRRDRGVETSFAEWLVHELRPDPQSGIDGRLRPLGTMAHNVATQETETAFTQGPLEATGRNLDFALAGNGFFQVEGEEDTFYTRNGRFALDQEGFLVTEAEGYQVVGEAGPIQLDSEDFSVTPDGTIYEEGDPVGQLSIAVFEGDVELERAGYNFFITEEGEGGEEDFEVLSGFLEGSNVSMAREMTAMMQVRRTYEAAQKIMMTYDQILEKAANELGSSV